MTGMGGVLRTLALLGLAAAVIVGGRFLWNRRPWRPAVVVNGRILSVGELDLRAHLPLLQRLVFIGADLTLARLQRYDFFQHN